MNRTVTWWVLAGLLVVFDVVTVAFHLFTPLWQTVLLGASAVLLAGFGLLRWMDWRMRRDHARAAYAALARLRGRREPPSPVRS